MGSMCVPTARCRKKGKTSDMQKPLRTGYWASCSTPAQGRAQVKVSVKETVDRMLPGGNAALSEHLEATAAYRTPGFSDKAAHHREFPGTQGN